VQELKKVSFFLKQEFQHLVKIGQHLIEVRSCSFVVKNPTVFFKQEMLFVLTVLVFWEIAFTFSIRNPEFSSGFSITPSLLYIKAVTWFSCSLLKNYCCASQSMML